MSVPSQYSQLERAYEEHADALLRFCLLKVRNREKAVDIVQDAFVKTLQYMQAGNEVLSVKSFLYKTAHNLVIDDYRRKHSDSLDDMSDQGFDIASDGHEGLPLLSVDSEKALRAVHDLDEKYKDIVLMRFIDDLSPKEISELTGLSENVVSVRIHRALEKLRIALNIQNEK
ncbi:MAG TPA: RNA polymerase sigma factor [Candidatus Paceibacterota bacterium]|nr:RNA polymerase sigma factor [Candidatus Paceibacterota bacterium]